VSPHGAGLTNVVFSKRGVRLIEIFNAEYIVPDFYIRLKLKSVRYSFVVTDELGKYLGDIDTLTS